MNVRGILVEGSSTRGGLATPAQLRADGVTRSSLSRALAREEVTRVRPGVYAALPLPPWPVFAVEETGVVPALVQHVRAALLSLGDTATAAARTAACLRGWGLLVEPQGVVDVVVARGRCRVRLAGLRVLQRRRVDREQLHLAGGDPLWVTTAVATVLDCCRLLSHEQAVVVCDSALRSGQVTLPELQAAAARLRGVREARRVRRALASSDPEAGSVLESVLRVRMVAGGITGFATQQVVRERTGRRIVRVDFCFAGQRLAVEADGARWPRTPDVTRGSTTGWPRRAGGCCASAGRRSCTTRLRSSRCCGRPSGRRTPR